MARHKTVVGVHICLIDGDRIFLLRRFQTGYEDGSYTVIAGHVEADEPAKAAAVREVAEEAGVTVCEADLDFFGCMHRRFDEGDAINLFFIARRWDGVPINAEPSKCDQTGWYLIADLPPTTVSYVRWALEQFRNGQQFLEYGWP